MRTSSLFRLVRFHLVRVYVAVAVILAAALSPDVCSAAVEWHADLDTAHAASRISRRPVLAVFVASWGDVARSGDITCLDSPEAEAVLAACFEPVRVDTEDHAGLTRALGITHVPTACVLAADDTVLARFEMSGSPASFVKEAVLAAQRAAAVERGTAAGGADHGVVPRAEPVASVFGSAVDPAHTESRPPRGSMARVTAKVRELSAFATGESRPAAVATPVALAQASRPALEPQPDYVPLAWPAEPAAAPPTAPTPPTPSIEPAATALTPSSVSPWLGTPPARPATQPTVVPPAAPPQAAATPLQAAAPLPPTTSPSPQPAPQPSGWMAALQKPFMPTKPAAEPPTVAPALPRGPFTPAAPPDQASVAATAEVAAQGSMPLGLEGYCPVTLVDRGVWTEGRAQWGARHRGRTYLFAGPDEQRTFLAAPDRYAPALSGDDPVLALDRGSATPGQRRYGVTYQSRMYLFATPETRTAFSADPARYTGRIALAERPTAAGPATRTY